MKKWNNDCCPLVALIGSLIALTIACSVTGSKTRTVDITSLTDALGNIIPLAAPVTGTVTTSGCTSITQLPGGIGIPPEPTQANPIDICKPLLTPTQAATLQIMFNNFPEVLLDGVHTLSGTWGGT